MADAQIKITADVAQAERDIKKLERAIERIDDVSASATKALAGITAAAAAMGYAILKTLDSAGELIDTAENLGVAVGSLQAMQKAAALTGVSADQLNASLYKLNANIGDALIKGTGPAVTAFERLGLSVNQLAGMKADQAFKLIAQEINKIPNGAERSALAMDLMGKQGPKMLRLADDIDRARASLERMGLALSDTDVAALDMAGDAVDELAGIFDSVLKKAVADIAPLILGIVKSIKEAIEEAGGFEAVWGRIKIVIKEALNIAIFTAAILAMAKLVGGALALYTAIKNAGTAMVLFNTIVKKNPLMLAVGAALLLAKVLGFDVAEAMYDYTGLSKKVEESNKDIAATATEIKKRNEEVVEVTNKINEAQQKVLKAFDEQLSKLQDQVSYEQERLSLGENQANINKMIAEEQRKMAVVGLTMTQDQKDKIANAIIDLDTQKKITAEVERQRSVVKSLAGAYESELLKALYDYADVQERVEEIEDRRARKQKVTFAELRDSTYAQVQAESNLQKAVLNLVDKGEAERYGIQEKYNKQSNDLLHYSHVLRARGVDVRRALVNNEMAMELELYNLKVKLANDEVALKANTMARVMSESNSYYLKTIGGEKAIQEAAKARAEFEAKTIYEKTQIGIDQGAQLFSALGAQNKKAFEAAKALNIASAIMNTYTSVTKALAAYPFPFSLIPAGAALAMGMAQVAQIRSQSYSGRALGGPVMGGNPYIVGENGPELFTPSTTGNITRNDQLGMGGGVTNINFNIQANDAQGFDDLLVQRRGMITQMVSDALVEKGQRAI